MLLNKSGLLQFTTKEHSFTVVELGDFLEKMLRSLEELLLILISPRVAGNDKREVLLEFRAGGSTLAMNSSFAILNASSAPIKPGITESMRCLAVPIAYQKSVRWILFKFECFSCTCARVRQVG